MSRYKLTNLIIIAAAIVLIALIGAVTLLASRLVNDTVDEQFRSQELQLVTSLSQQAEAAFNLLNADITSLSLQPDIKSAAVREHEAGLQLMQQQAEQHAGVIRSIVRYNFQGNFRYAWPPQLDAVLRSGEVPPFQLPEQLVSRTESGDEVPLEIELRYASRTDDPAGTYLLIAPVYTPVRRTEFIVFELDLAALFRDVMSFVALKRPEQLWVVGSTGEVLYQATDHLGFAALEGEISLANLLSIREPALEEYALGDAERLAAIAPVRNRGKSFVVVLSRDTAAAQAAVEEDLQEIFALAVGAILLLALVIAALLRYLGREAQRRQQEIQRRQTARTLLEISRALNSTLRLEDVLRSIMAELMNIVPYDSAAILLLDRSKLTIAAHRGAVRAEHQQIDLDLDEAQAANRVIRTGRPVVIHDTRADERWKPIDTESEIRSWMGVPLRVRDKTVGVLNINSHRVGRFTAEEVELAEAFADQASIALQNARLHEMEVKQIEQELSIARDIQTSLLPSAAPEVPELDITAYTMPARQVNGDYYQYLPLPDGRIGIAVGDVSGKGIPAAILMAVITTALRDEITRNLHPADLLVALNRRLVERTRAAHVNSALLIGIFDPPTRHLELANGGMVQPYLRNGSDWVCVPVGGFPLGISLGATYTPKTVTLAPGAMLLIMSDGLVEAQNAAGEIFGFERLEQLLRETPPDITGQGLLDRILAAMRAHTGGEEAQDDLTLLILHSVEVPAPAAESAPKPERAPAAAPASEPVTVAPVAETAPKPGTPGAEEVEAAGTTGDDASPEASTSIVKPAASGEVASGPDGKRAQAGQDGKDRAGEPPSATGQSSEQSGSSEGGS